MKPERTPKAVPPPFSAAAAGMASHTWESLAPRLLHPVKLVVIEALLWVEEPMSATGLAAMLEDPEYYGGLISYHLAVMAEAEVVTVVTTRSVRGAEELFFYFPSTEESGEQAGAARGAAQ